MAASVSRETSPSAATVEALPEWAPLLFGERLELAAEYVRLLATDGITRGLIGPAERGRLWTRHVGQCALLADLIPAGSRLVDAGSGAGLPGIPLAIARPDLRVTLTEPMERRVTFLREAVDRLHLSNVTVTRERLEELPGAGRYDVAVVRAVAPLTRLLTLAAPLLRTGAVLLAVKGSGLDAELAAAAPVAARLGCTVQRVDLAAPDHPLVLAVAVVRRTVSRETSAGPSRRSAHLPGAR